VLCSGNDVLVSEPDLLELLEQEPVPFVEGEPEPLVEGVDDLGEVSRSSSCCRPAPSPKMLLTSSSSAVSEREPSWVISVWRWVSSTSVLRPRLSVAAAPSSS
jgi:hypothetical protein